MEAGGWHAHVGVAIHWFVTNLDEPSAVIFRLNFSLVVNLLSSWTETALLYESK